MHNASAPHLQSYLLVSLSLESSLEALLLVPQSLYLSLQLIHPVLTTSPKLDQSLGLL